MKYGNGQARCQLILFPFPRHRGRPHFPFSQELHWTMWLANGYGQKWCIPLPGLAMNCFSHPFALPLPETLGTMCWRWQHHKNGRCPDPWITTQRGKAENSHLSHIRVWNEQEINILVKSYFHVFHICASWPSCFHREPSVKAAWPFLPPDFGTAVWLFSTVLSHPGVGAEEAGAGLIWGLGFAGLVTSPVHFPPATE